MPPLRQDSRLKRPIASKRTGGPRTSEGRARSSLNAVDINGRRAQQKRMPRTVGHARGHATAVCLLANFLIICEKVSKFINKIVPAPQAHKNLHNGITFCCKAPDSSIANYGIPWLVSATVASPKKSDNFLIFDFWRWDEKQIDNILVEDKKRSRYPNIKWCLDAVCVWGGGVDFKRLFRFLTQFLNCFECSCEALRLVHLYICCAVFSGECWRSVLSAHA